MKRKRRENEKKRGKFGRNIRKESKEMKKAIKSDWKKEKKREMGKKFENTF